MQPGEAMELLLPIEMEVRESDRPPGRPPGALQVGALGLCLLSKHQ